MKQTNFLQIEVLRRVLNLKRKEKLKKGSKKGKGKAPMVLVKIRPTHSVSPRKKTVTKFRIMQV